MTGHKKWSEIEHKATRPRSIVVGPVVYDVTFEDMSGQGVTGRTGVDALRILISTTSARGQQRDTLLHEILHAIFSMVGLTEDLGPVTEESHILRLAPAILDVLRRNPDLVQYLIDDA